MNHAPDVTVVIPACNVSHYLGDCLDSILAQTAWRRCQVIVVDDGSTDDTGRIGAEYAQRHPRIRIISQPNRGPGPGAARNNGLDRVDTEYVMFLDGDDELSPRAIELLCGGLERFGLDLAVGATEQIPQPRSWPWSGYFHPGLVEKVCIEDVPLLVHDARTCNKLYRTEPLKGSGLRFAEGIHHQDTVVNVPSMLTNHQFVLVGDAVHRYRKRAEGNSIMDSHFTRLGNYWDHLQVIETLSAMTDDLVPSRRPLMQAFIARSFQGFSWRAPMKLPSERLREFFDRSREVIGRLDPTVIEQATRDASQRAAYVTMIEGDFDSFVQLERLSHELRAHEGNLYLNIPTTSSERRALLKTGATRAWADHLQITAGHAHMRLRLRIQGADRLDTALSRIELRGLVEGEQRFACRIQVGPTTESRVYVADMAIPLTALAPGDYQLRLGFGTPTGRAARWVRIPPLTASPNESSSPAVESAKVWGTRISLTESDQRATLRVTRNRRYRG